MCLGGSSSVLLSEQEIIPTVPPTFIGHFFGVGSRAQFLLCSLRVLHFTSLHLTSLHIPLACFTPFHFVTSIFFTPSHTKHQFLLITKLPPPPGCTYVPHFRQCSFTCQHFLEDTRGPYLCAQLGIIIAKSVPYCIYRVLYRSGHSVGLTDSDVDSVRRFRPFRNVQLRGRMIKNMHLTFLSAKYEKVYGEPWNV